MSGNVSISIEGGATVARREIARPILGARNFASAEVNRFNSTWTTTPLTADEVAERNLRTLVARSREQRRNNDYVKGYDWLTRVNVAGPNGIIPRPKPVTNRGKIDDQAKKAWIDGWNRWVLPENCSANGEHSWKEIQGLGVSSCVQSGEFLVRKIFGPNTGPFGFQLQLIDPLALDPSLNRELANGSFIRLGIEFDASGRKRAYWIKVKRNAAIERLDSIDYETGRAVRVPASEIYHVFLPEEIGQKRGFPWPSTSLERLRMLEAYQETALIAARAGATKVAWLTKKTSRGYGGPKDSEGFRTMNAEPGTIEEVDDGTQLLNWDPAYPHGDYDPFMKRNLQGVSSGLLVSYTTLANDPEGATFSSERSRKQSEKDLWLTLQGWLVDRFIRPVTQDWLLFALTYGQIASGGRTYAIADFDRLSRVGFQGRAWSWATNPLQEAAAAALEVDKGFRSRDDVISQHYGEDPSDVDDEIAESQARAKDKKLALSGPGDIAIKVDTQTGGGQ